MTAAKLAESIGTAPRMIQYLEAGTRRLNADWLEKIALALGVRPPDLIESAPPVDASIAEEYIWDIIEGVIEQARKYPQLSTETLVSISKRAYRAALRGEVPEPPTKAAAKKFTRPMHIEATKLAEYEVSKFKDSV